MRDTVGCMSTGPRYDNRCAIDIRQDEGQPLYPWRFYRARRDNLSMPAHLPILTLINPFGGGQSKQFDSTSPLEDPRKFD